jgi:hypothetical protein
MGDVGTDQLLPHRPHRHGGLGPGPLDEAGQRALAQRAGEEVGEKLGGPCVRDHLAHVEIDGRRLHAFTLLDRGSHARGEGGGCRRSAGGADAALRAVLDDLDAYGGKLEDLAPLAALLMEFAGALPQKRPALGAAGVGPETMLDDTIGAIGLEQGLAGMTVLPAGLASGLLPQALRLGRRIEAAPVGGGRPAAVAIGNRVVLRARSRTLASSASTRSHNCRTRSAMASGSLLARAISASRVGRWAGTMNTQAYNFHSTSGIFSYPKDFWAEELRKRRNT